MNDELIERVARALAEDAEWRPWSNLRQCEKKLFRSRAQAALAALKPEDELGDDVVERVALEFARMHVDTQDVTEAPDWARHRIKQVIQAMRLAGYEIRALSVEPSE